jgi:hypothetical protein
MTVNTKAAKRVLIIDDQQRVLDVLLVSFVLSRVATKTL